MERNNPCASAARDAGALAVGRGLAEKVGWKLNKQSGIALEVSAGSIVGKLYSPPASTSPQSTKQLNNQSLSYSSTVVALFPSLQRQMMLENIHLSRNHFEELNMNPRIKTGSRAIKQIRNFALGAISTCVVAMTPMASQAANIQLGFILDESGSISASEWNIIRQGLASAINLIPVGGPDSYYLSIVTFGDNAVIRTGFANTAVTAANRASLSNAVANFTQNMGATNYEAAFKVMDSALGSSNDFDFSYVNFATDGEPNACGSPNQTSAPGLAGSQACAIAGKTQLVNSGVDNISIEGIGVSPANAAFLQNSICYPGPCDTTDPFNFPTQGFYIGVANAAAYAAAVQNKIRIVTGQVPEPGTLALLGLALLAGLGFQQRRRSA